MTLLAQEAIKTMKGITLGNCPERLMINPRSSNTIRGADALMRVKCGLAAAFEHLEAPTCEKTGHVVATTLQALSAWKIQKSRCKCQQEVIMPPWVTEMCTVVLDVDCQKEHQLSAPAGGEAVSPLRKGHWSRECLAVSVTFLGRKKNNVCSKKVFFFAEQEINLNMIPLPEVQNIEIRVSWEF